MPAIRRQESWSEALRTSVRSSTAKGWNVYEFRGQVRLELRSPGQPKQTVFLPFDWAKASVGDVLTRVRNIYPLVAEGHTLKAAAEIADGKAPKPVMDWAGAVERFRVQKMEHGRAVKQVTWNHSYAPVIADAVAALTSQKAPTSPANLLDQMIRQWATGSRMRQNRAQALSQFLRYCVSREGFPAMWLPPTDLRAHIGSRPTQDLNRSKGDPIEDQQIINLLASLPVDAAGGR